MTSEDTRDAQDAQAPLTFREKVVKELKEWGTTLAVFVPLFFVFSMLAYEQRVIPSESMVPTLRVGDRVAVSKFAYGYNRHSVPWGIGKILPLGSGTLFQRTPQRGDVAVFEHPHFGRVMIKRVIGLPGDTVEMRAERLYINGEPIESHFDGRVRYIPHGRNAAVTARVYSETIDGHTWLAHQWGEGSRSDTTPVFQVPEAHILFMGDNRDNSKDGRDLTGHCPEEGGVIDDAGCDLPLGMSASDASIGFVPLDHIIGRAETVIFSTHRCNQPEGLDCLPGRLWKSL